MPEQGAEGPMSSDGPRAVAQVRPARPYQARPRSGDAPAHPAMHREAGIRGGSRRPYQHPCRSWHARIALTSAAHRARASTDASSTPRVVSRASSSSIWHDLARSWGSRPVEAQPSSRVPHGPRPEHLRRPSIFLSSSRRLRTFHLPVAPPRANVDGRRLPAAATTRRNRVHDPARDRLDHYPR